MSRGRRGASGSPPVLLDLTIESLDHEGRGIARHDGKVIFVEGALSGERVLAVSHRRKPAYEEASVHSVIHESASRVRPRCRHFGVCGGCSLQHMDIPTQVAAKQRVLEDNLARIGNVVPEQMLPAVVGPAWGYRHRARLTVRDVIKKGGVLVGFHERRSSYVADMDSCEVLPRRMSDLLLPLRGLVAGLSIRQRLPQIELALTDDHDTLVLRVLEPLTAEDEQKVRDFADHHQIRLFLQPKGPETAAVFHPPQAGLPAYDLPEFDVRLQFSPTEFTQVNHQINRVLVRRAMRLLDPQSGDRVADLFCGLGNFTLPIACSGATVLGVEGSAALIGRANHNAAVNGLADRTTFVVADLFKVTEAQWQDWGRFDKLLIDPPRDGAMELVKVIGAEGPRRIVYVSCNPATLARDAAVLTAVQGYRLRAAGVVNMFPHTAHVESMALFERD